ncbi:MAG: hypothetical protein A4E60_01217 [Syntrophorhabdus sp. PtaB.Bin047]|nr:MAG: hypothetical protein A4E60_01217 [Syntrophorhabdus sp. PtaB.Bin047]
MRSTSGRNDRASSSGTRPHACDTPLYGLMTASRSRLAHTLHGRSKSCQQEIHESARLHFDACRRDDSGVFPALWRAGNEGSRGGSAVRPATSSARPVAGGTSSGGASPVDRFYAVIVPVSPYGYLDEGGLRTGRKGTVRLIHCSDLLEPCHEFPEDGCVDPSRDC